MPIHENNEEIRRILSSNALYPFQTVVEFDEHLDVSLRGDWMDMKGYDIIKLNLAYWHPRRGVMAGLNGVYPIPPEWCGKTLEEQYPAEQKLESKIHAAKVFLKLCKEYEDKNADTRT